MKLFSYHSGFLGGLAAFSQIGIWVFREEEKSLLEQYVSKEPTTNLTHYGHESGIKPRPATFIIGECNIITMPSLLSTPSPLVTTTTGVS